MDVLHAYGLLREACQALDETGDYAVAAYVGHGLSLLEAKYGIDPEAIGCTNIAEMAPPAKSRDGGSNWA